MDQITTFSFHYHKGVAAHDRPFAIGIALQSLTLAGRFPFRAWTVEAVGPRGGVISTMTTLLDAAGNTHVIDLADARGVIAVILEMLRPCRSVANLWARTFISQHTRRMRIIATHK